MLQKRKKEWTHIANLKKYNLGSNDKIKTMCTDIYLFFPYFLLLRILKPKLPICLWTKLSTLIQGLFGHSSFHCVETQGTVKWWEQQHRQLLTETTIWMSSKKAAIHVRNRGCWCLWQTSSEFFATLEHSDNNKHFPSKQDYFGQSPLRYPQLLVFYDSPPNNE